MTTTATALKLETADLKVMANRLRGHSILMTTESASGHPTTCMSCAEIVSALFFQSMDWDPADPTASASDVFVLSKGHAAPILYAALKEAGAIDQDLLDLRKIDSPLEGHPTPNLDWVRVASGSLGQGLSAASGMAKVRKMDGHEKRVFCLTGDGEVAEGAVWEAAAFASHYELDNLCAIVDVNGLGQSGVSMFGHDPAVYARRFEAFGWHAIVVDGHDVEALVAAFAEAKATTGKPTVLVARTEKGKGWSEAEGKHGFHGKPIPRGDKLTAALAEIGDADIAATRPSVTPGRRPDGGERVASWTPGYEKGQKEQVATRQAYGQALVELGNVRDDVFVIDGDTKNSTFAEKFAIAHPDRYVEAFIAEQNMIGVALGAATEGKIAFASSFAAFLTRAYDFIRMAAYSRPGALIVCGSHCGVSIGEDGASQMGLEDIAMMRAVYGSTVLYPSDAVSAERCVQAIIRAGGVGYIRTSRPKTAVIYDKNELFPVGGSKTLRSSDADVATLIGAGVTLHESLAAAETLAKDGIAVRVIDLYSVQPIDTATLQKAAAETKRLVVVEDHSPAGGLGEAVAMAVAGKAPIDHLCVKTAPRSGKPDELLDTFGISAAKIVEAVRAGL